jgi:hypothetical protein
MGTTASVFASGPNGGGEWGGSPWVCPACVQIIFTALWQAIEHGDHFVLIGNSHIWAMPIYGVCLLVCEQVYLRYHVSRLGRAHWREVPLPDVSQLTTPLLLRCVVYMVMTFAWEYTSGTLLHMIGGTCPWDYSTYFESTTGVRSGFHTPLED